jgi:uncharacterized damage-inducible protein DinB
VPAPTPASFAGVSRRSSPERSRYSQRVDRPSDFVRYFGNVRARTERLIPLIPPDRLEWSAGPGALSFGDLLRHLAGTERWMWAENVAGRPARYPGHGPDLASGYDATCRYVADLHAESMVIFESLTPEQYAAGVLTPGGVTLPAWKWLRAMIEHEAHHRGQLYLMLRLIGVSTPPVFGLTSEEVRARSSPDGQRE